MSDKTYWVNKNVKRQLAKSGYTGFECGGSKGWMSTVMVVGVVLAIFGLMQFFMNKQQYWLYIAIAAGAAFVVMLIINIIASRNVFTEYVLSFEDKELIFQYVGKKHIFFACDGVVIEFVDRKTSRVDHLYKPYRCHKKAFEVIYPDKIRKGQSSVWVGTSTEIVNGAEKDITYKIKLNDKNKIESYYVGKTEFRVYFLTVGEHKLAMPIPLYNAIKKEGIALPDDSIITLVYEY